MLRLSAGLAVAFLATGCALLNQEDERLRTEQVEAAVAPMARVAVDTGQLDTATRLYNRLLDVDPQSLVGHMGLGDVALANGDSDSAADWYYAAIVLAQTPEQYHEAVLAHGRAALDAGRLEEARESFLQLTEPGEGVSKEFAAWGHNGAGLTLLLQGDLAGAIAYMEQAVRQMPREPTFRENLQRAIVMRDGEPVSAAPPDDRALAPVAPAQGAIPQPAPRASTRVPDTDVPATPPDTVSEAMAAPTAPPEVVADAMDTPAETAPAAAADAAEGVADAEPSVSDRGEADGAAATPTDWLDHPSDADAINQLFDAEPGEKGEEDAPTPSPSPSPDVAPDVPAGALIVTANGQRYLQLGAYRNRDAAETLVDHFSALTDEPVFIATDAIGGEPMHRVRAGPLDSDASMRRLLEALAQD